MHGYCGGEGYINERFVAVDETSGDPCPGCPDCNEWIAEQVAAVELEEAYAEYREAWPLWVDVTEVPRRPMVAADVEWIERTA